MTPQAKMAIQIYGKLFMANVQRVLVTQEVLSDAFQFSSTPTASDSTSLARSVDISSLNMARRITRACFQTRRMQRKARYSSKPQVSNTHASIAWELSLSKKFGFPSDEAEAEKHKGIIKENLQGYECILTDQKYLAGDTLTLADLWHLPYGAYFEELVPEALNGSPNVQRWWKNISSRPSWKAVLAKSG
ncbi:hypothetical protein FRC07_000980 [Ceratobasidium sp. 392]|nr:hypothetical protein FRC07_000980 [Ceratobasidium sp. 392]